MKLSKKQRPWILYAGLGFIMMVSLSVVSIGFLLLTPRAVQAPAPQAARQVNSTVSCNGHLLFMGDTMLARNIGEQILAGKDPYRNVTSTLQKADLRIANVETTIADSRVAKQAAGKLYTFNAPLEAIDILKGANINVSVLANNHTSDYGAAATTDMITRMNAAGLSTVGAGSTPAEAFAPRIKNVPMHCKSGTSSVKVAFIAANDIENNYTAVSNAQAGGAYFDKVLLTRSIKQARKAGAQFIIVIPHWGIEYHTTPTARQTEWAHWFIDNGADVVIGGHPHVMQPTETYKGHEIVYSMGNFIFDQMEGADQGQMISLPVKQIVHVEGANTTPESPSFGRVTSIRYHLDTRGFPVLNP